MVTGTTILSNNTAEQSFIDAAKDWLNNNKDAVLGVAGAYTGAEFEKAAQEIKKHMYTGNTDSLRGLYRQKLATNQICKLEIGSAFLTKGLTAISVTDAIATDIKNGTPDETLKAAASLSISYSIGGMLTAVIGTSAVAAASVALVGAGIAIYIDNNWEGIKREGLSYIWDDFVNGVSNVIYDAMVALDDNAKAVMDSEFGKIQQCLKNNLPNNIDELFNSQLANNPENLNKFQNLLENNFCPLSRDPIAQITPIITTAEDTRSPLIIDIDGDGIETTTVTAGVHFDHDNNGFAEKTGWVGKDDGLLVRDINGNGQIDNGTELFGNNSVLSNGQKAANGFEALKDLDDNKDGVFNNADTAWNEVKVWNDINQNGFADEGELLTLEQIGIENINLNYQNSNTIDINGNTIGQTGSFNREDGSQGSISDIWFNINSANTVDKTQVDIPDDIAQLPNISGFGNVHDLHTAMALDTSGELKALVQQYAAETDSEARQQILYNIIYHWTGVQDMDPNGRDPTQVYGKVIDDTRKLEALEEFMGKEYLGTWCWGERDPNPHGKAAPYILRAFDIMANYINNELLI